MPPSAGRRGTLAAVAVGNFSQLGARLLVGAVVPFVLVEFHTGTSTVGLALTGMWLAYALAQFPSGVLADRYGERRLVLAGVAGTGVGAALVAVAPSVAAFAAATLVLGAGAGLFFAPAAALLSRLFDERGGPLSALTASGAVAGVAYPAVGGVVGMRAGWRPAVALGAVVALPVFLGTVGVVPRLAPATPERRLRSALDRGRVVGLLTRPSLVFTTALAVLCGFAFQALSSFLPTFLVEYRSLTPATAGVAFGAMFALSSGAQVAAGRVSDALSRDAAIAGSAALAATGIALLLAVPGRAGTVAGVAVLGVGVGWPGAVQARFMDRLSEAERGYGFGLLRTVYMCLAASGSAVVGVLGDASWVLAYGTVAALLACCLALVAANRAFGWGV